MHRDDGDYAPLRDECKHSQADGSRASPGASISHVTSLSWHLDFPNAAVGTYCLRCVWCVQLRRASSFIFFKPSTGRLRKCAASASYLRSSARVLIVYRSENACTAGHSNWVGKTPGPPARTADERCCRRGRRSRRDCAGRPRVALCTYAPTHAILCTFAPTPGGAR